MIGVARLTAVGSDEDLEMLAEVFNEVPAIVPEFKSAKLIKHYQNDNSGENSMRFEICFEHPEVQEAKK